MSRPTVMTPEVAREISVKLAEGESLRPICSSNSEFSIYVLCEPDTGIVRYVGKSNNPKKRLAAHLTAYRSRPSTRINRWIKSLLDNGLSPQMTILQKCNDWDAAERFWVKFFKELGADLTNANDGGKDASHIRKNAKPCPWRAEGRRTPLQLARANIQQTASDAARHGMADVADKLRRRMMDIDLSVKKAQESLGKEVGMHYVNFMMAKNHPAIYGEVPGEFRAAN